MEQDHLVRRIGRHSVDRLARRLRRQVPVFLEQFSGDGARDTLEVLDAREPESAEEDRPVLVVPAVDLVPMRRRPRGEVDAVHARTGDQGQQAVTHRRRLDEFRDFDRLAAHRAEARRLLHNFLSRFLHGPLLSVISRCVL